MAVKLKLNNAEVPELCRYISRAKDYRFCEVTGDDLYIQEMVQQHVFDLYRTLGARYMHRDSLPSYSTTLTKAAASALMMYYEGVNLPDNKFSRVIIAKIFSDIHKQLQ